MPRLAQRMLGGTVSSILAVLGSVPFLMAPPAQRANGAESRSNAPIELGQMERAGVDSLQHLLQERYSGLRSPLRAVLQDSASFRDLWDRATRGHRPLPAIDFNREMVIVAAMGAMSSTGHSIHIQSVQAVRGILRVRVLLTPAAPGCGVGMMETYPIDVVRAPRGNSGVVTFVEQVEEVRCGH